MDKFSELVARGVASFHYTPVAPETPTLCSLCRLYNNIYASINNTHMSPLNGGRFVITGRAIRDKEQFENFLCCSTYKNVDVRAYGSPLSVFTKCQLRGHYDVLNGDMVYMLEVDESIKPTSQEIKTDETPQQ